MACLVGLVSCGVAAGPGCGFDAPSGPVETVTDSGPHPDVPSDVRATRGLVALWRFDEASGGVANDARSAVVGEPPLAPIPLPISDPARIAWGSGGLRLDAPVRVGTPGPAHVSRDVLATGEVTLEVWASPATVSQGAGRVGGLPNYALVLAVSPSYAYHNAMIAQVGDRWQGRVLTTATDANANPVIETPAGTVADLAPVHLVLVASPTERTLYVNGVAHRVAGPESGIGALNAPAPARRWFDYFPVSIGRERDAPTQPRPWLGTLWLAAIYDRALTEAEIQQHRAAGHDCAGC